MSQSLQHTNVAVESAKGGDVEQSDFSEDLVEIEGFSDAESFVDTQDRILELFQQDPDTARTLRELAQVAVGAHGLSAYAVTRHAVAVLEEGHLLRHNRATGDISLLER